LKIEVLPDIAAYSKYAEPALGVFASEQWLSIYGKDLELFGLYNDGGQLNGGFYLCRTKKAGLPFDRLPPYTPHCGFFFSPGGKNPSSLLNSQKEAMQALAGAIESRRAAITVLAFPAGVVDMQPFIWRNFKVVPNYTYRIDLGQEMAAIRAGFDPKHRNAISRAEKAGHDIVENATADELYEFFSAALKRSGANVYDPTLRKIFFEFAVKGSAFSIAARASGKVEGAVFCVYDRATCYYMFGGTGRGENTQGLNNLLVQMSIEKAKTLGCSVFDFEGSMLVGVERFFRGFGPALVPYYTVNKAWLPIEILLKFRKRALF
jgi:hypothetical protein